jgi:hypothetical protein
LSHNLFHFLFPLSSVDLLAAASRSLMKIAVGFVNKEPHVALVQERSAGA